MCLPLEIKEHIVWQSFVYFEKVFKKKYFSWLKQAFEGMFQVIY